MAKQPAKQSEKKTGGLEIPLKVKALPITQGAHTFFVFVLDAKTLWSFVSISRRHDEKDEGYQRVLSNSRVDSAVKFIQSGEPIPNSILLALEGATYDADNFELEIPAGTDVGWVIDGQHRLAAAHTASEEGKDIELCVVAFVDVELTFQISQFITINREAKGVPTSLLYDLLKHLPGERKPVEIANERAAEIANSLRKKEDSVFRDRIVVISSPRRGSQLSITNFVRKVAPLVHPERGSLRVWTLKEQTGIIDNYYDGLKEAFPEQWDLSENIFFQTIGFGAIINVFEEMFSSVFAAKGRFRKSDVAEEFAKISGFDFKQWSSYGSGNKAEIQAAQDLRLDLARARALDESTPSIDLG
ncbi:DGQHR domain-containing protein [Sulfitobacter undariae]|uniref:DGQHR domain-containing protein n=1 Tax=Sulfitobacter undariae TaxID=1563671 RepID=A0A7W6H221_9RHOB|nr:DGQHR domain-containing protein [Sulfitobacter undariae]MBB3996140.1 DGQHR domain-containing protein [Sulfitobacter undariae]